MPEKKKNKPKIIRFNVTDFFREIEKLNRDFMALILLVGDRDYF
jgi:hypothetical protein